MPLLFIPSDVYLLLWGKARLFAFGICFLPRHELPKTHNICTHPWVEAQNSVQR